MTGMRIPNPPLIRPLEQLSPSIYESVVRCKARAAWTAHGQKSVVPQHPKAMLGVCLHAVIEAAHRGRLAGLDEPAQLAAARALFDERALSRYEQAHPLLRAKFSAPDRLPYYNLYRERAALEAVGAAARAHQWAPQSEAVELVPVPRQSAERRLLSRDGLLVGQPDYIDLDAKEIVDYKTAAPGDTNPDSVSDAEARQLRLYVHLALDNGLVVSRGVIARADGRRAAIDVSPSQADAEGQSAREHLAAFNEMAGRDFREVAQPSADACTLCPCIPFCEAFWQSAAPEWADTCGTHAEGTVANTSSAVIQGVALLTLGLTVQRGTVAPGPAIVQQLPETWSTAGGTPSPVLGDVVRLVHCRTPEATADPLVLRVDRVTTALWTAPSQSPRPSRSDEPHMPSAKP